MIAFANTVQEAVTLLQSSDGQQVLQVYVCCPQSGGEMRSPTLDAFADGDKTDIQIAMAHQQRTQRPEPVSTDRQQPRQKIHHNLNNRGRG
jgi:hypothetical protein